MRDFAKAKKILERARTYDDGGILQEGRKISVNN
jgi:hypothetical protein